MQIIALHVNPVMYFSSKCTRQMSHATLACTRCFDFYFSLFFFHTIIIEHAYPKVFTNHHFSYTTQFGIIISYLSLRMNLRQQITQFLTLAYVFSSAFMLWKTLSVIANSHSPIVVVLSGSMEPAFQRGDILFLWNRENRQKVGDIVVYEIDGKSIPIVHRVLREHHNNEKQLLLTKGDNNAVDDLSLYAKKQQYLNQKEDLVGTVKGYLPFIGYVTILISENVYFKYGMLGLLGLSALFSNE